MQSKQFILCLALCVANVLIETNAEYDFGGHGEEGGVYAGHGEEIQYGSFGGGHGEEDHGLDYHAHPKYSFDYAVKDVHTGDEKEHWETRDGDKVKGSYSLVESDGTKRVVQYEADKHNGFNAVVHKIGTPKEQPQAEAYAQEYPHSAGYGGGIEHSYEESHGGY